MKKVLCLCLSLILLVTALTACGTQNTDSTGKSALNDDSEYYVEIENFNRTTVYDKMPERIVSLSYSETEILVALGLEDKIVGIAEAENKVEECDPRYQEIIKSLPVIASSEDGGTPSFETLLTVSPDFVYATSYSLNAENGVGELSDFEKYNMQVYVASTTYQTDSTIQDVYGDIRNIAKIFQVEASAEEIISEMQAKLDNIVSITSSVESPVRVFAYVAGNETRAATVGGNSIADDLMGYAGVENVFGDQAEGTFPVSIEALVEANPDVIILLGNSGGSGTSSAEEKKALLKSLDVLKDVTAIKEDRFVVIPYFTMCYGTFQNAAAAEMLAQAVYPELFAK